MGYLLDGRDSITGGGKEIFLYSATSRPTVSYPVGNGSCLSEAKATGA
jgi:hypothetical protein